MMCSAVVVVVVDVLVWVWWFRCYWNLRLNGRSIVLLVVIVVLVMMMTLRLHTRWEYVSWFCCGRHLLLLIGFDILLRMVVLVVVVVLGCWCIIIVIVRVVTVCRWRSLYDRWVIRFLGLKWKILFLISLIFIL